MTGAPTEHAGKTGTVRTERRLVLLDAMADHLLDHGLAGSPLRALAAAAGTSDRMLLYYFADRGDLLTALLDHVAGRLAALLATGEAARRSYDALLAELWATMRDAAFEPYMLLFVELAAAAGRGEEPHRAAAARIVRGFIGWIAERLDGADNDRAARAARLIATLDGLFVLRASGCAAEADAAAASC